MRSPALRCATLGLLLLLCRPAAAENARLPYHYLHRIQQLQTNLCLAHPDLQIILQLQSASPDVKNSDVQAYLDSKTGKIPIPLGPYGDIALPERDDLLAEDPWLITNQPKGTMQLNWQAGLSRAFVRQMTNAIHYGPLMRAMRDCEEVQEKMREFFPGSPKLAVAGLRMIFPPEIRTATVIIHAKTGDRKLQTDADGELIVPMDPDLRDEDPLMTLSSIPAKVQLVSRKVEE
jgi:hypothetical protein